jgi:Ca2+/Na+ antiporter
MEEIMSALTSAEYTRDKIILAIICIFGLIALFFIRKKYWKTIKDKKLEKIFYGIALLLILIPLLVWSYHIIVRAVLLAVATLFMIAIFYLIKENKTNNTGVIEKTDNQRKIDYQTYKKLEGELRSLKEDNKKKQENIDLVLKERNDLDRKYRELMKKQNIVYSTYINEKPTVPEVTKIDAHLYANAIIDGVFNKITEQANEDTVYELLLKTSSDKIIEFTIYKSSYGRVIACIDLVEGCDIQIMNNNRNSLDVEKGSASLQNNGRWKIIKKAKIKFI